MEEEEFLQLVNRAVSGYQNRNKKRFRIVEDLTLTCDMCKTPEARRDIQEMTRQYFAQLQKETLVLNKELDLAFKKVPLNDPSKNLQKNLDLLFKKMTSVAVGRGRLKLDVKAAIKKKRFFIEFKTPF